MTPDRSLVVVADDYGIGPETSRGIRELACEGHISATVLLVNSPYAKDAVAAWRRAGWPGELGWHPNLTLDHPILPPTAVPSLVRPDGSFWPLGRLLLRALTGRLNVVDIVAELRAQYGRFCDLVGSPPPLVNAHQHVATFPPVERLLRELLRGQSPRPFLRRIGEPLATLLRIPGAEIKRVALSWLGRRAARRAKADGFPGCSQFAGLTDPAYVADPRFFARWLRAVPGNTVELMCHPGYHDRTLIGRDCSADNQYVARRVFELDLLRAADYSAAIRDAGFRLVAPSEVGSAVPKCRSAISA
jgi:predicted glycoside hydrolase/deacetylase ChbG (UPF0249 family)